MLVHNSYYSFHKFRHSNYYNMLTILAALDLPVHVLHLLLANLLLHKIVYYGTFQQFQLFVLVIQESLTTK